MSDDPACLRFGLREVLTPDGEGEERVYGNGRAPPAVDGSRADLTTMLETRSTSLAGHRARALAFCIWDDGELARRAMSSGFLEDRLLWAIVGNLAREDRDKA